MVDYATRMERRTEERVRTLNLLNLFHRSELYPGRTLDLSPHGAQVELSAPLPTRTHPPVSLQLCLRDRIVGVHGRVVWARRRADGHWLHGVHFDEDQAHFTRAVEEHLERA